MRDRTGWAFVRQTELWSNGLIPLTLRTQVQADIDALKEDCLGHWGTLSARLIDALIESATYDLDAAAPPSLVDETADLIAFHGGDPASAPDVGLLAWHPEKPRNVSQLLSSGEDGGSIDSERFAIDDIEATLLWVIAVMIAEDPARDWPVYLPDLAYKIAKADYPARS